MAKLPVNNAAGWNAGKTFYAKTVRPSEIKVDPEIASVFKYKEHVLKEIIENIRRSGYDKSQPIAVWQNQGELFVLDGHTRLAAAAAVGLDEVPVVVMDFEDKEDAILYTFERQVVRRNLEPHEVIFAVKLMMTRPGHKKHDGTGRSADRVASRLGFSSTHIYQTKKVIEEAPAETIAAIEAGEKSIKEAYAEITKPKREARKEAERKAAESVQELRELHDRWNEQTFNELVNEARPASTETKHGEDAVSEPVIKLAAENGKSAVSLLDNTLELLGFVNKTMSDSTLGLCICQLNEVKALISTPV